MKANEELNEECLICKAPLEYLKEDIEMECAICHKKELSKTRCINGHFVCSECHTRGIDRIRSVPFRNFKESCGNNHKNDEASVLSYAWSGTSHNGGCCSADC